MDTRQFLQLAQQHAQAGRTAEAEKACRDVLAAEPGNGDAANLLGILLLRRNEFAEAAEQLATAARARPDAPDILANLGHALRLAGRLDEAAAALERAIALRPVYPIALNNLGLVRRAQGRFDEAVAAYRRAIDHLPSFAGGYINFGNVLRDAGDAAGAAAAFRQAVALAPADPNAHAGLAGALDAAGDSAAAVAAYEAALRINPHHVPSLVNLGLLVKKQGPIARALSLLRQAERVAPASADVQEKLGRALFDAGSYDEGVAHLGRAVQMRPSPEARVNLATLIPPIYRSLEDVTVWRQRLRREVAALRGENVEVMLERRAARAPFYVPYAGLDDDREVLREIALLHQPPADPPLKRRAWQGKVRVGFISSFFKDHTVGLWTQGIITKLPREQFEVVVLSIGRHEDEVARFIHSHADEFHEVPPLLPAAREAIAALGLDVLIYADIGMEPVTYTLAFSRLAPVQCVMWGHPATSGIEAIDYYLSSELAEAEDAQRNYTEKLVRFKHLPLYYYRPPTDARPLERSRFDLPAEARVYGCLHTSFKLHPAYDAALAEILRRDAKAIVIVPRATAPQWDDMIAARFAAGYGDVAPRLRFIDRVTREDFRGLNLMCDVTLAPFPFGAGDTSLIAFSLGIPVVTMPTPHLRGRFTLAMYRAMGLDDCVAKTVEQYAEIAVRLANDPAWRREVRAKIEAGAGRLFENKEGVLELAEWLTQVGRPPAG